MSVLSGYVRNIAVFMIFISFLGIILPADGYKKYINLVMGLVLILLIAAPLGRIFIDPAMGINKMLSDMELELNRNIIYRERDYYEQTQFDLVMETYEAGLLNQLEGMVESQGFRLISAKIDIDDDDQRFGHIDGIQMIVEKLEKKTERTSLIRIEKVEIGPRIQPMNEDNTPIQEDEDIKNLKNYLSDFYNLSVGNIYIVSQV